MDGYKVIMITIVPFLAIGLYAIVSFFMRDCSYRTKNGGCGSNLRNIHIVSNK